MLSMNGNSFCIIGAGVVGSAIAKILSSSAYSITGIYSSSGESALRACDYVGGVRVYLDKADLVKKSDIIFLTVSDSSIEKVCKELALEKAFSADKIVIHTSGALSSEVLFSASEQGASVFSMHPIQSFAGVEEAVKNLKNSFFGVEGKGTEKARQTVKDIIDTLGGFEVYINTDSKVLYHAAAVVVSNYLVTLVELGCSMMCEAGVDSENAFRLLKPLIIGTLNNIDKMGTTEALTGPIARGDVITVDKHLQEIEEKLPNFLHLFKILGSNTLDIAKNKGKISEENYGLLSSLLRVDPRIK